MLTAHVTSAALRDYLGHKLQSETLLTRLGEIRSLRPDERLVAVGAPITFDKTYTAAEVAAWGSIDWPIRDEEFAKRAAEAICEDILPMDPDIHGDYDGLVNELKNSRTILVGEWDPNLLGKEAREHFARRLDMSLPHEILSTSGLRKEAIMLSHERPRSPPYVTSLDASAVTQGPNTRIVVQVAVHRAGAQLSGRRYFWQD